MARVVINNCYGGFSISARAAELYWAARGVEPPEPITDNHNLSDVDRCDPVLLQVIDQIGLEASSGLCAKLAIEEVEDGALYQIREFDGKERVEFCREDWKIAVAEPDRNRPEPGEDGSSPSM